MKRTYTCPACKAVLNPEHAIILRASEADRELLLGLHPEPGCYDIYLPSGAELSEGGLWRLTCPVCGADLQVRQGGNICLVHMQEAGERKRVYFSRVAGEHVTFVVNAKGEIEARHGAHSRNYEPLDLKV